MGCWIVLKFNKPQLFAMVKMDLRACLVCKVTQERAEPMARMEVTVQLGLLAARVHREFKAILVPVGKMELWEPRVQVGVREIRERAALRALLVEQVVKAALEVREQLAGLAVKEVTEPLDHEEKMELMVPMVKTVLLEPTAVMAQTAVMVSMELQVHKDK
jgi:hypothetical protein